MSDSHSSQQVVDDLRDLIDDWDEHVLLPAVMAVMRSPATKRVPKVEVWRIAIREASRLRGGEPVADMVVTAFGRLIELTDLSSGRSLTMPEQACIDALVLRIWLATAVMTPYKAAAQLDSLQAGRMTLLRQMRMEWVTTLGMTAEERSRTFDLFDTMINAIDKYQDARFEMSDLDIIPLTDVRATLEIARSAAAER